MNTVAMTIEIGDNLSVVLTAILGFAIIAFLMRKGTE